MTYEIKITEKIEGKTFHNSFIVDGYEFTDCKKGHCIKFKQEGKKSATYLYAEKKCFHEEFELIITEATTGRRIFTA